jgi:2-polyprenyl-3-methyl-5-hydroxy-6-metoxy-1,4-benzoquinol methylase
MTEATCRSERPGYDVGDMAMLEVRAPRAAAFAKQVLDTVAPFLKVPVQQVDVLDVGCGYGHTALELARHCRSVEGIDPTLPLIEHAQELARSQGVPNLSFRALGVEGLTDAGRFDLVVLDNVLEHLPDQALALSRIADALRPGGVVFMVVPNKLWPVEVHYKLPFLSYLPLRLANRYLRWAGRGTDYTDASYAPTYFGLNRLLRRCPEVSFRYVVPADVSLAMHGHAWHYKVGVAALRRCPWLWPLAKVFLVVGVKR